MPRCRLSHILPLIFAFGSAHLQLQVSAQVAQADYEWSSVAMGGGGCIPGIVLHPKVPGLAYIHTDVGGAYRWDEKEKRWIPLLDHLPANEWNLYGVDSIAVDPNDATGNTVYLTTGKYVHNWAAPLGVAMKSTDRGATWTRLPLTPTGGSNQAQGLAERLAVDPANSQHLLYAPQLGQLAETFDGGKTWTRLANAPSGIPFDLPEKDRKGSGLAFVIFHPPSGTVGTPPRTRTYFVGSSSDGVHQTDDGGATFRRLEGGPLKIRRGAVGKDGSLVVSGSGGVHRYAKGVWTDITPPTSEDGPKGGSTAIAVDPEDPERILATMGTSHRAGVFSSTDGGKSWRNIRGKRVQTVPWWPDHHWFSAPSCIGFDPQVRGRAWATDWYGVYKTEDVNAKEVVWTNQVTGAEEVVTIGALLAPAGGKYRLFSGVADVGGFDHVSLATPPAMTIWGKGVTTGMARTGIAQHAKNPTFFASVFTHDWNRPGTGAYSLDGGATWTEFSGKPSEKAMGGRVLLTGTARRIFWAPQKSAPAYSDDLGKTWTPVKAPIDLSGTARGDNIFAYDQPLTLDPARPDRVYLLCGTTLLTSDDAGASFKVTNTKAPAGGAPKVAASGRPDDLWLAGDGNGLQRSRDGGKTFTRLPNIDVAKLFCLGKPKEVNGFPTLFLQGTIAGATGYFRSDDEGSTWVQIDIPTQRVGNDPNTMVADWRTFGGIFVGTNGRGIYHGQPKIAPLSSTSINAQTSTPKTEPAIMSPTSSLQSPPHSPTTEAATEAPWRLVWSDEFDYSGLPDPAKWNFEVGFIRNQELQYYTDGRLNNARVENGSLVIEAKREPFPNAKFTANSTDWRTKDPQAQYTSACLNTANKGEWKYGRFEVRAKLPKGGGTWPAIWTLGAGIFKDRKDPAHLNWPACGEIDIMETVGSDPDTLHATLHFSRDGTHQSIGSKRPFGLDPSADFHVYAVEWHPDRIEFFLDGQPYQTVEIPPAGSDPAHAWAAGFHQPHALLLNLALGGQWAGKVDDACLPQRMTLDYVRVYQREKP